MYVAWGLDCLVVLVRIDATNCPHYAGRGTAKRRKLEENGKLEKWLVSHSEVSGFENQIWMFYGLSIFKPFSNIDIDYVEV